MHTNSSSWRIKLKDDKCRKQLQFNFDKIKCKCYRETKTVAMVAVNIWNYWKLDNRFSTDNLLDMSGRCQWRRNWAVSCILLLFAIRILKRQPFFACNELVILFVMIQLTTTCRRAVHFIKADLGQVSWSFALWIWFFLCIIIRWMIQLHITW